MSSEEYYLNGLLNYLSEKENAESLEEMSADAIVENSDVEPLALEEESSTVENTVLEEVLTQNEEFVVQEEPIIMESVAEDSMIREALINEPIVEEPIMEEVRVEESLIEEPLIEEPVVEEPIILDELSLDAIEIPELPDIEIPDLDIKLESDLETLEIPEITEIPEFLENESDIVQLEQAESAEELKLEDLDSLGLSEEEQIIPEVSVEEPQLEDIERTETLEVIEELELDNLELSEDEPVQPETDINLTLEDIEMPGEEPMMPESDEFKLEDIEMPGDDPLLQNELNIDGLEEAIQSETELEMAGELNIGELDFGETASELGASVDLQEDALNTSDDLSMLDDNGDDASDGMDNSLEDVLNMLDDDAELAEINDMLKKSDSNEPIQDDMMDILNQMADDEAASVNAGVKHVDDEDDGGVPLPEIPQSVLNSDGAGASEEADEGSGAKKKGKKDARKKKKGDTADKDGGSAKESGKMGKLFNMLTEELVPEPTEEELAAEKEAKAAKKQEALTKKEEEKLAKEEEKKAKEEEKAAAAKAKQEAAAQKKKEKQAAKEAKLAAKRAKEAALGPKKRIPPKKIAAAALFGASVGGAVILATNILSAQGYLHTARNAYYDEDYKTVYQATFDMELDETASDGLIKARSEVILKIQRRYDSYQTNLKMGREMEALDALLMGIATYDFINADAEKYGVATEVDAIKAEILNTLAARYNVDETKARELINNEDALTYTIALDDIISGN